ncbi:MAG: ABC transporter ATP-binding protein [Planctomycetes bacterium]|nr:ABC transporter ATP-binding protein [Planctomycetota bacterium]
MTKTDDGTDAVVQVRGLCYSYKTTPALKGVAFSVAEQCIHGFVGPNGAGKTTTLKILATLLKPQGGQALVFGLDVKRRYRQVRRRIGFMPDHSGLYQDMTVFECLDFFAAAYGLRGGRRDRAVGDLLELTDMAGRKDSLVKGLSRGMMQRLNLARALVHDPDLLLLDEPASGLDPRARIELTEILRELSRMGKTVFISSHILSELADLCDSVTIIDRGVVKYSGSVRGLHSLTGEHASYVVTLEDEHPPTQEALEGLEGVLSVTKVEGQSSYRLAFDRSKTDTNAILRAVLESGGRLASFREDTRVLSQAFMELTEPGVP